MRRITLIQKLLIALAIIASLLSCGNDDSSEIIQPKEEGPQEEIIVPKISKYIVGFEAIGVGGNQPVDYLLNLSSLESLQKGEVNVLGKGLPQNGWRYFHKAGNSIVSVGYSSDDQAIVYQLDDKGDSKNINNFTLTNNFDKRFLNIDQNTLVIADLVARGKYDTEIPDIIFSIVDTRTGKVISSSTNPIDNKSTGSLTERYAPHINGMAYRDGKIYASYHKLDSQGGFNTIDGKKAYIAVLNYPSFTLDKLIEDDRTNVIGVDGHYGLFKTENDYIYSYSSSSKLAGILQDSQNPSGLLRIKKGTTDFDKAYFFDVENAINGGILFWADYIGNGKAIARIFSNTIINFPAPLKDWAVFAEQGPFFKLVILDLKNKTITDVQNMPEHANRYTAPVFIEDGKAYLSARVGNPIGLGDTTGADGESHVYIIDPKTATATKGAKIKGLSFKGIFKIDNQN